MRAERYGQVLRRFKARHWIAAVIILILAISGIVIQQNPHVAGVVAGKATAFSNPTPTVTANQPQTPANPVLASVTPAEPPVPVVVPREKWVLVSTRNVRLAPNTANVPLRQLNYRDKIAVGDMVKGQDPYGTGKPDWFKLPDGAFVWSEHLADADPGPKPVVETKPRSQVRLQAHQSMTKPSTKTRGNVRMSGNVNWAALRQCESSGNYRSRAPHGHYGAYQFDLPTWRSVGGKGNPADASPAEQDMRAQMLYNKRGLQPWECAWAARR